MSNIKINSFPTRKQYTYAGGARIFVLDFPFFEDADIFVYVSIPAENMEQQDPLNIILQPTQYLVAGAGLASGGTVTIEDDVDLEVGWTVTVVGRMVIDRFSILNTNAAITREQYNEDMNRLTMMIQNLNTIVEQTMPKYDRSEFVNTSRQHNPFSMVNFPALKHGEIWLGILTSGDYGLTKQAIGDFDALGLLDVDYVIGHPNPFLPNAQPLVNLDDGYMVNNNGTVITRVFEAGPGVTIENPDGIAGPTVISAEGGGGSVRETIPQEDHSILKYQWVRPTATPPLPHYIPAISTNEINAESLGIATDVSDPDEFVLQQAGFLGDMDDHPLYPFTPLAAYFLSDTVPGGMQLGEPNTLEYVSKPVFIADRLNGGWVLPLQRGQIIGSEAPGGGPTDDTNIRTVTQPNDFEVGELLRIEEDSGSGLYVRAQADSFTNALRTVMVIAINVGGDPDVFRVQSEGWVDVLSGLSIGEQYYLSPTVAGAMTTVRPTDPSHFIRPVFIPWSTISGWLLEQQALPVPVADSQNITTITQVAHGFIVKDVVRVDNAGTDYIKAIATSIQNATASGMVIKVIDADTFMIQQSGETSLITGMTPGQRYWLSSTVAGALTDTEPTANGVVSKLMYVARLAAQGQIQEQRPMLQPNANGGGGGGSGLLQSIVTIDDTEQTVTAAFAAPAIPLISEGIEVFSVPVIIQSDTSTISVSISLDLAWGAIGDVFTCAFFTDEDTEAFAVLNTKVSQSANIIFTGTVAFEPGVSGAVTFSVRVGLSRPIAGRSFITNRAANSLRCAPVTSTLTINEIAA